MGKMKEELPEFEIRYESDMPTVVHAEHDLYWAMELAVKHTSELRDEGAYNYMKRVENRARLILRGVANLKLNENATSDLGDLD